MTTLFAFRLETENLTMLGACTESFGTTRKKVGNLRAVVKSVRVADGETAASCAALKSPALEITA